MFTARMRFRFIGRCLIYLKVVEGFSRGFQGQSMLMFTSLCYTAYSIVPPDLLSLFSYTIQYHLPRSGTALSDLGTPYINHYTIHDLLPRISTAPSDLEQPILTINQEEAPQTCLQTNFFFFLLFTENLYNIF